MCINTSNPWLFIIALIIIGTCGFILGYKCCEEKEGLKAFAASILIFFKSMKKSFLMRTLPRVNLRQPVDEKEHLAKVPFDLQEALCEKLNALPNEHRSKENIIAAVHDFIDEYRKKLPGWDKHEVYYLPHGKNRAISIRIKEEGKPKILQFIEEDVWKKYEPQ